MKKNPKEKTKPRYSFKHVGRPPQYDHKEQIIPLVKEYFSSVRFPFELPTKVGLRIALHLSRESYNEYKRKDEFVDTIKEAENLIEQSWTQRLGGTTPTGAIFYLKNAFKEDFKDKQEVEHSGGVSISKLLDEAEGRK